MTDSDDGAAFYQPLGLADDGAERFASTDYTRSVWSTEMQHGSPPAALLVRAMERNHPREGARLARVTVELLGPVPVAECRVRSRVLRPGRSIELLAAELCAPMPDGSERTVASATAWRLATEDTAAVRRATDPSYPEGLPAVGSGFDFFGDHKVTTFIDAVEWEWNSLAEKQVPGRVRVRERVALVAGEQPSPVERMFCVIDAANGVGATLDPREWTYLNTEMTVHIHRIPGDGLGIAAESSIGPDGIGMCTAVIHDDEGPVARTAQSLLVRRRT
ncbi:thioesterase family protein [Tomitella fengzijianii]|uniref:Thioesterase family protein n=1 Tax=Tomitella fengzijianii TaxID=2597660 RepID=A0A516X2S8_9ACTN|nr:thioesterase family protein [Tomitella fengzijianii]QDQ97386.1 thioesterase family protein [Tomitella fengzijianii]